MRCKRVQEHLSLYLVGELDPTTRAQVDEHLALCAVCAEELEALRGFLDTVGEAMTSVPPSPGLAQRIMEEVAATPLPRQVRASRVPRVPVAEDEERDMRRRTTAQLILAAAVILLIVVFWQLARRPEETTTTPLRGLLAAGPGVQRVQFEITVYNNDLAVVRDVCRLTNLKVGDNEVRFDAVPARIDPTSVTFQSKSDPAGTTVVEQNYEYDLASPDKILERYVDHRIEAVTKRGTVLARYLAGYDAGQLVLTKEAGGGRTEMLSRQQVSTLYFDRLPEGLLTKPTLVWNVRAHLGGDHETVVSYMTGGMKWWCNYVLVKQPGDKADLKAWVTIDNHCGASFPQAKLKLMAGDVRRVQPKIAVNWGFHSERRGGAARLGDLGFTEKAFFEYHLYTLGRETDLLDNSTKQIELSAAQGLGTTTQYVFEGGPKVAVYLKFKNAKENGLGVPLPKGVVRVMEEDSDGSLEFIGEDEIDHTPKDEEVEVLVGHAFDLVGERKVLNERTVDRSRRATIQVKLRNHKAAPVTITVRERIQHDWCITKTTHEFKKIDAHTVEFEIPVARDGESVLRFSYEATW